MKKIALAIAAVVALSSVARAQEYREPSRLEQVQAYCESYADRVQPPSPVRPINGDTALSFGITAGIGLLGIATDIGAHAANYDRCMTHNGYAKAN